MSPSLAKMSEALDWAVGGGPVCAQAVAPAIAPAATKATASLAAATRRLTLSAISTSDGDRSASSYRSKLALGSRPVNGSQRKICWLSRNREAPLEAALMIEV